MTRTATPLESTSPSPEPLHGPAFGSYRADEVSWLLTDLSDADLERGLDVREPAIVAGRAHYAESLPIEYQPTPEYRRLFLQALHANARRVAADVGTLAEHIRRARTRPVLVSLARAGTPIGILVRRWLARSHDGSLDPAPPHYAVSIVRDRGIDLAALSWLAARHDPAQVVFIDGWTGKGAIARELRDAVTAANAELGTTFSADLGVLADPGHCVEMFGTRADYLIPSACLNATVSGLVSRTVLNRDLLGPGAFHGAKFYAALADQDVSALFLDTVTAQFSDVADDVLQRHRLDAKSTAKSTVPTWAGWFAVQRLAREYGISNVHLVKPGVGEATRVLLRRRAERVLVRPALTVELSHLLQLADERDVPVEPLPQRHADLPYSCVALIAGGR